MQPRDIEGLFASPVSVSIATPDMYDAEVFAGEADAIVNQPPARRREFAAGRACAREALLQLGRGPCPIGRGQHGAPAWPPGFTGSITHCEGFCAAVAAIARDGFAIGLDAEDATPLAPHLVRQVCGDEELEAFMALTAAATNWGKIAFCAKEAFLKACFPLTGRRVGFDSVSIRFANDHERRRGAFTLAADARIDGAPGVAARSAGRWRVAGGRIFAGVTIHAI